MEESKLEDDSQHIAIGEHEGEVIEKQEELDLIDEGSSSYRGVV